MNPSATSIHPLSGCGSYIHGQQMKNHYTSLADLTMLFMSHYTPPRIENNWLVKSFHHIIVIIHSIIETLMPMNNLTFAVSSVPEGESLWDDLLTHPQPM